MLITGDTTINDVPSIVTKKGETIEIAVNEENEKFDYAVLTDMFHYGHLDEEKLRAGLRKEMDAMTTFYVYEEVDANYVSEEILQMPSRLGSSARTRTTKYERD